MPYRFLAEIPPLGLMRLPHRWLVVSSLCIAFFAARFARNIPYLWVVLLGFEAFYFHAPSFSSVQITPPSSIQLYQGPVLELPARLMPQDIRGRYLYWQRTHHQPIAYSLLMQGWSSALDDEPLLIALCAHDRKDEISVRSAEAAQFRKASFAESVQNWQKSPRWKDLQKSRYRLKQLGFRQVVLYPQALHPQDALEFQRILEASLGMPVLETEEVLLWGL